MKAHIIRTGFTETYQNGNPIPDVSGDRCVTTIAIEPTAPPAYHQESEKPTTSLGIGPDGQSVTVYPPPYF